MSLILIRSAAHRLGAVRRPEITSWLAPISRHRRRLTAGTEFRAKMSTPVGSWALPPYRQLFRFRSRQRARAHRYRARRRAPWAARRTTHRSVPIVGPAAPTQPGCQHWQLPIPPAPLGHGAIRPIIGQLSDSISNLAGGLVDELPPLDVIPARRQPQMPVQHAGNQLGGTNRRPCCHCAPAKPFSSEHTHCAAADSGRDRRKPPAHSHSRHPYLTPPRTAGSSPAGPGFETLTAHSVSSSDAIHVAPTVTTVVERAERPPADTARTAQIVHARIIWGDRLIAVASTSLWVTLAM